MGMILNNSHEMAGDSFTGEYEWEIFDLLEIWFENEWAEVWRSSNEYFNLLIMSFI